MAKKAPKKSKPAAKTTKKVVKKASAKPVKKLAAKKPVAKKVTKAPAKPVKKVEAKKVTKKVAEKPLAKKADIKKTVPVQKVAPAKPIAAVARAKPAKVKPAPVSKREESFDSDDDNSEKSGQAQPFYYEPPKAFIKRPDLSEPKPFIGKDKRTRYSDKELGEFKGIILGKLEEAQKDYELLKSTLSHKDDHGTDDTSPTFKLLEDGSDVMSKEETAALASRQEKYIQSLQNALIRIENKSYGICRVTGRLIPKERLRSVPHATTSIEGKMQQYA